MLLSDLSDATSFASEFQYLMVPFWDKDSFLLQSHCAQSLLHCIVKPLRPVLMCPACRLPYPYHREPTLGGGWTRRSPGVPSNNSVIFIPSHTRDNFPSQILFQETANLLSHQVSIFFSDFRNTEVPFRVRDTPDIRRPPKITTSSLTQAVLSHSSASRSMGCRDRSFSS